MTSPTEDIASSDESPREDSRSLAGTLTGAIVDVVNTMVSWAVTVDTSTSMYRSRALLRSVTRLSSDIARDIRAPRFRTRSLKNQIQNSETILADY